MRFTMDPFLRCPHSTPQPPPTGRVWAGLHMDFDFPHELSGQCLGNRVKKRPSTRATIQPLGHFPPATLRPRPSRTSSLFLIIAPIVKSQSFSFAPLANHVLSLFINLRPGSCSPMIDIIVFKVTKRECRVSAPQPRGPTDLGKNYEPARTVATNARSPPSPHLG